MVLYRPDATAEGVLVMAMDALSFLIEVTPEGLPLAMVVEMFRCRRVQVRRFMDGCQLGTPRDYSAPSGAMDLWFTPEGLRNLAALLGHDAVVVVNKKGRSA